MIYSDFRFGGYFVEFCMGRFYCACCKAPLLSSADQMEFDFT